ncbi:MAG: TraB/VirB10 family protein [Simkaniaceae bacterium]|nr:MAG: TraB/VirB10 family protein [Simkaniaceae bacterium]
MANHLLKEQLERTNKQQRFYLILIAVVCAAFIGTALFEYFKPTLFKKFEKIFRSGSELSSSSNMMSNDVQIARIEIEKDAIIERIQFLEKLLQDTKSSTSSNIQLQTVSSASRSQTTSNDSERPLLKTWGNIQANPSRNVFYEIPAGTVVKCMISSAADCRVALKSSVERNIIMLRPIQDGILPNHIFVPLKNSVIIGTAIGDISSERVYINGERITLAFKNGEFIETEIEAFVSGEDRKEGIRGTIIDRSEFILNRPGFSSLMKTISQEHGSNNEGNSGKAPMNEILTDYYIKRTEQLQPSIQIQPGRVVNLVFTKAVKIREPLLESQSE